MIHGLFIGLATIDLVYSVDEFPAPNTKIVARSVDVFTGGPATNAAVTFCHLGGSATLAAKVGRHPLANVIHRELDEYAIRLIDLTLEPEEVPVIASIAVNRAGERNVISPYAGRAGSAVGEPPESVLREADVVLVDGHAMETAQVWASAARRHGVPVVLDGGSWKAGTKELLSHVDYAICSADFHPPGCASQQEVLAFLKDCGVPHIAITNGAGPVVFTSGSKAGSVPVPAAEVVDTTGAGDVFHGAFAHSLAAGRIFEDALAEAARVASYSCRFHGTREWMRNT